MMMRIQLCQYECNGWCWQIHEPCRP